MKRLATGIVLILALVFVFASKNPFPFWFSVFFVSQLCLYEFLNLREKTPKFIQVMEHSLGLLILALFFFRQLVFLPFFLFIPFVVMSVVILRQDRILKEDLELASFLLFGILYVILPFGILMTVKFLPNGNSWIIFLIVVVAAGDISAYYVGKGFGKRPLSKEISPKKTWEGAIGSILGSILSGMLFLNVTKLRPLGFEMLILLFFISISSQVGDLFESWLKRVHKKKDSGIILPGHGGFLDRVDGLLFGAPVLYVFLTLREW